MVTVGRPLDMPSVRIATFLLFLVFAFAWNPAVAQDRQGDGTGSGSDHIQLLIRCDDIGMCHSVNEAFRKVVQTGIPVSASVMFACPWYQEAVDLLKNAPHVSVGIHLTLNAEWKNYRWGPVLGAEAVPSLVDSVGYFFPSRALLFGNDPDVDEAEAELRAQIERAIGTGLRIDYVDYHMGAAVSTPEFRDVTEKLAREYGLGISRYFGETDVEGLYNAPIESKKDTLLKVTRGLDASRLHLLVFHVGLSTPEMDALRDLNPFGLASMSKHREAELRSLVSSDFRVLLSEKGIQLLTYGDLIRTRGLDSMGRPASFEY